METALLALAQQGQQQPPAGCGGGIQPIIFMLLMFAVFWFILIRPQQKKAKEHAAMLGNLKKGDQVITRGGVVGRISGVQDNLITIEVQEKVRIRIVKGYIDGKYQDATVKTTDVAKSESPSESKT